MLSEIFNAQPSSFLFFVSLPFHQVEGSPLLVALPQETPSKLIDSFLNLDRQTEQRDITYVGRESKTLFKKWFLCLYIIQVIFCPQTL